jgi:site-specific recombinase XerD
MLTVFRRIVTEAAELDQITEGQLRRILRQARAIRGESLPAGRALSLNDVKALLDAQQHEGIMETRNAAMIALLFATGLRCAELCALDVADVGGGGGRDGGGDGEDGLTIKVRRGKGRKDRLSFVSEARCLELVGGWLKNRGQSPGPLFAPITQLGAVDLERRLCDQQVRMILRGRAAAAGIGHVTPHDLRRTYATAMRRAGADLEILRDLLGHASLATTQRYLRRDEDEVRAASRRLKL